MTGSNKLTRRRTWGTLYIGYKCDLPKMVIKYTPYMHISGNVSKVSNTTSTTTTSTCMYSILPVLESPPCRILRPRIVHGNPNLDSINLSPRVTRSQATGFMAITKRWPEYPFTKSIPICQAIEYFWLEYHDGSTSRFEKMSELVVSCTLG